MKSAILYNWLDTNLRESWDWYTNRTIVSNNNRFIGRSRHDAERLKKDSERAKDRKSKIGSGDRSERIRTYNFPQGRITDHRINFTMHKLTEFMNGELFDEMIENLSIQDQELKLKNLNN